MVDTKKVSCVMKCLKCGTEFIKNYDTFDIALSDEGIHSSNKCNGSVIFIRDISNTINRTKEFINKGKNELKIKEYQKNKEESSYERRIKTVSDFLSEIENKPIPTTTFDDIKGTHLKKIKESIMNGLLKQYNPDFIEYAKQRKLRLLTRTLFNGNPGLGKTLMTTAIANELKNIYPEVRILNIRLSDLVPDGVGKSDTINIVMDNIRKENRPTLINVDEAELLFLERGESGVISHERTAVFLSQFDGWDEKSSFPLYHFIFCTNKKVQIDKAMMSRFNDIFDFEYPSEDDFIEIWNCNVNEKLDTFKLDENDIINLAYGCDLRIINTIATKLSVIEFDLIKINQSLSKNYFIQVIDELYKKSEITSTNKFIITRIIQSDNGDYKLKDELLKLYHEYCKINNLDIDSDDIFWKKFYLLVEYAKPYRPNTNDRKRAIKGFKIV